MSCIFQFSEHEEEQNLKDCAIEILLFQPKIFIKTGQCNEEKMTTPSRKLRHTAIASLTVFITERGGGVGDFLFQ